MPFLKKLEPFPGTMVGFWKLDESTDRLFDLLSQTGTAMSQMENIKLEKRKREFAGRHLLMRQMQFDGPITHLPNGKPIAEGKYISFSHSDALVAFLVSDRPAGVDLQKPDAKLLRIASKFVSPEECANVNTEDRLHCLTRLWTVKEAVFKIFGAGVNFKDVLLTSDVTADWVYGGRKVGFEVHTDQIEQTIVTVACTDAFLKSA